MNKSLVISHNTDMLQPEEAVSTFMDIESGFVYNTPDFTLKRTQFDKMIEDLKMTFGDLKHYEYASSKHNIRENYVGDEIKIYSSGTSVDTFNSIVAKSESNAEKAYKIYLKYAEKDDDVSVYMHSYYMNDGRLDANTTELKAKDLDTISPLYYPYIDTNVMFEQFFTGAENILLLVGSPGLGKSKLSTLALKHAYQNPHIIPYDKIAEMEALENQYITCVYVKSTDVLVNDKFWRELEKQKADFCIIDDLDYMLTKRDAEVQNTDDMNKNTFLNQFLSFTDGIEKHNTKFIITTNQTYDHIDAALLREGRLFDILEFRSLKNEEALVIWKENALPEKDFHDLFQGDEVFPAKLGSEINKRLNKRIGSATKKYLLEDGISKVKKAGKAKEIDL